MKQRLSGTAARDTYLWAVAISKVGRGGVGVDEVVQVRREALGYTGGEARLELRPAEGGAAEASAGVTCCTAKAREGGIHTPQQQQ